MPLYRAMYSTTALIALALASPADRQGDQAVLGEGGVGGRGVLAAAGGVEDHAGSGSRTAVLPTLVAGQAAVPGPRDRARPASPTPARPSRSG